MLPVSVSLPNRLTTGPRAGLVSLARFFGKLRKSAGFSCRAGAGGRAATWVSPPPSASGSAAVGGAVTVGAYRRYMRVRSPRWGTVSLPTAAFRAVVRPFRDFAIAQQTAAGSQLLARDAAPIRP